MTLAGVVRGIQQRPLRIAIYGTEGVGKSTFAAAAPAPIFLPVEDGTAHLDVERFPRPETWDDALEAVRILATETHDYKTLVVDTLDALEALVFEHVCKRDKQENIEAYGYGKGYEVALVEWRKLLAYLERMREKSGVNVILVAHALVKPFKNPEGEDYDRYQMKLHPKAAAAIREWCDDVLFARHEEVASKDTKTKRIRGVSTGARIVNTRRTAAYDAKNRHDLPESMPLSWADYFDAVRAHKPADPAALLAEIGRKAKELGPEVEAKVAGWVAAAAGDASKLAKLNDWCNARINEKTEAE